MGRVELIKGTRVMGERIFSISRHERQALQRKGQFSLRDLGQVGCRRQQVDGLVRCGIALEGG
jgi:hypothetical protein